MTDYPLRVRLHGGRNTHAARKRAETHPDDRITACGVFLAAYSTNNWLADDKPITCRACTRQTDRA
ncbi:hypothetical protein [Streptomyces racemochromogenes]|uniref:hypothetical protein n=1 Tax=Streptomyces racemochromogenes TaxID=67353 RepID=UPI0031E85117